MGKKITCIAVIFLLILSSCSYSKKIKESVSVQDDITLNNYNEKAKSVTKSETVYVNLDSSGKLMKINVSDWIHTDKGRVYVDDFSELDNIRNIKGDSIPQISDGMLRWHMDDRDLYYSGTTNKMPPILFDIEYYLNGSRVSPDDIAGKSGETEVKIKIRNNLFKEIIINGNKYVVTLPAVVVGGMILPEKIFKNVSVKNAHSFNDGTKQLISFATIPGFNQSLGLENASEFTEMFTAEEIIIRAQAESFVLENMYFGVIPFATLNYDMSMPEAFGDAGSAISSLKALRDAINELDPERIIYSLISDEAKVNSLIDAMNSASDIYSGNKNLIALATKYSSPENIAAIKRLVEIMNSPEIKAMLEVVSDPDVQSFIKGLPVFLDTFGDVEPLLNELQKDLSRPDVQQELTNLPHTLESVSEITNVISQNKKEIDAIISVLDGSGDKSLQSVIEGINAEEFQNLEDKYGDVVEDSDLFVALAEEWIKFGNEYDLFSGKTREMNYSLIFIYKTESIRPSVS